MLIDSLVEMSTHVTNIAGQPHSNLMYRFSQLFEKHESMFNCLPRSFKCLRTESADFCFLNGRTIRTDCRSGVHLRGVAGVCLDNNKIGDHRVNKVFGIYQL